MFSKELKEAYNISGCLFPGVENGTPQKWRILQEGYARNILKHFNFLECKSVSTPIWKISEVQKITNKGKKIRKCRKFHTCPGLAFSMYPI